MPDENWDEKNPLEATLYGLPDYKDESDRKVKIPEFLKRKWKKEGNANDAWVNPSCREFREDHAWSPAEYVRHWIASWVREFGIDGFRCDIVENTRLSRWKELYEACDEALSEWRRQHPDDPAAKWDDRFYMTGDYENAGIDFKKDYADAGFTSLVNVSFPKRGDLDGIVYVWQNYADSVNSYSNWHPFNYLNNSYNREADMDNMIDCATTLMLSPGVAQIFYGDETGRGLSDARFNVDSNQAFRSDMNWDSIDKGLLSHFSKLGKIRQKHTAIGMGRQITLDSHSCVRYDYNDTLIIALKPIAGKAIGVAPYFTDGEKVRELYSGQYGIVENGKVEFPSYENNVAVIAR